MVYNDEKIGGDVKFKRHQIAARIYGKQYAELTIEEIALIKELIGKAYGPAVVGPAFNLLEGTDHESKPRPSKES